MCVSTVFISHSKYNKNNSLLLSHYSSPSVKMVVGFVSYDDDMMRALDKPNWLLNFDKVQLGPHTSSLLRVEKN